VTDPGIPPPLLAWYLILALSVIALAALIVWALTA
jgi:hypothetical protein